MWKYLIILSALAGLIWLLYDDSGLPQSTAIDSETKDKSTSLDEISLVPAQLCPAIDFSGYNFNQWNFLAGLGWSCYADLQYNQSDGSLNAISFSILSRPGDVNVPDDVSLINIQASLFDLKHQAKVKDEFIAKVKLFFSKANLVLPKNLINQITNETAFSAEMVYGQIKFAKQDFNSNGYGLLLIITPNERG